MKKPNENMNAERLRKLIMMTAQDSGMNFTYYERKEDEELSKGMIEAAIKDGVVSTDDITAAFWKGASIEVEPVTKIGNVVVVGSLDEIKPTAPAGLVERAKSILHAREVGDLSLGNVHEMDLVRDLAKAEPVPASSALLLAANAVVPDDPRVHGITPTFLNRGGEDLVGLYDAIAAEEKREPDDARDAAEVVGELLIEARDERDDLKKQLEAATGRLSDLESQVVDAFELGFLRLRKPADAYYRKNYGCHPTEVVTSVSDWEKERDDGPLHEFLKYAEGITCESGAYTKALVELVRRALARGDS